VSSTDRPEGDGRRRSSRSSSDQDPQVSALRDEVDALRQRLTESPRHLRALEERVADLQANLAGVTTQNERLVATLKEARDQIVTLKEEVDRLAQPPAGFGVFISRNDDETVDIFTGGRKLRVAVSPAWTSTTSSAARRSCSTRR
jgi:proteasome-associated ATPase